MLRLVPQTLPEPAGPAERAAIGRVLRKGVWLSGPETAAFEREFAAAAGVPDCVAAASGTAALTLALRALGVRRGELVAVPAFTASATAAAVEDAGAVCALVDVSPGAWTLDPASLTRLFAARRVRAAVAVHLFGRPADLPALAAACRRAGALLVEDCAQAHGAALGGRPVGTWGDAAAWSFHPSKNLAALGDAGAAAFRRPSAAARARRMREYGWRPRPLCAEPGTNARIDELQAAVLRARLPRLASGNARRAALAARYARALASLPLALPEDGGARHAWHQFAVRTPRRDDLRRHLLARGVSAAVLYPAALHRQPAYRDRPRAPGGLAGAEAAARELLCLPMSPRLGPRDAAAVCAALRSWRP